MKCICKDCGANVIKAGGSIIWSSPPYGESFASHGQITFASGALNLVLAEICAFATLALFPKIPTGSKIQNAMISE